MDQAALITGMRSRVEQCRRLAKYINDPRTTEALLKMAEDGEADIKRPEQGEEATTERGLGSSATSRVPIQISHLESE